jgi:hypothetical protein
MLYYDAAWLAAARDHEIRWVDVAGRLLVGVAEGVPG